MKGLAKGLIVFSIPFFLAFLLLFTNTGNLFLWAQCQYWFPQLQGNLVKGHLGVGVTIKDIAWHDSHMALSVDEILIHWQLSSLIHKHLQIVKFNAIHPVIQLYDKAYKKSATADVDTFHLPIPIVIDQLNITDFKLRNTKLHVDFKQLDSSLKFDRQGLFIGDTIIKKLSLITNKQTQQPQQLTQKNTIDPLIVPSAITLPFSVNIKKIQLIDSLFETEKLPSITAKLIGVKHQLIIQSLAVKHPIANLKLSGSINLKDSYPMALVMDASLNNSVIGKQLGKQNIHASLKGTLHKLYAKIYAKGTANATVEGTIEPLKKHVPFDFKLTWKALQWPLIEKKSAITIQQGNARLAGDLSHYVFSLKTNLSAPKQPLATLNLIGSGNLHHLSFEPAILTLNEGKVTVQGQLSWKNKDINWQGKLQLQGINPAFWMPELAGNINAVLSSHFHTTTDGWSINIHNMNAHGNIRGYPMRIKGKIKGNNNMQWRFQDSKITIGNNSIHIDGTLAKDWNLKAVIKGNKLKQLYPDLAGSITSKVSLTGNRQHPIITYSLNSPRLSWRQLSLSSLNSSGIIKKKKEYGGSVQLHIDKLHHDALTENNIELLLKGEESNHQLVITTDGKSISTDITLSGNWRENTWQGSLKQANFSTLTERWVLDKPVLLKYRHIDKILSLGNQCWRSGKAFICIEPSSIAPSSGKVHFILKDFNVAQLQPFYPEGFVWKAGLSGKGHIQWHENKPELSLHLSTTPGTIIVDQLKQSYEKLNLLMTLNEQSFDSQFYFSSQMLGKVDVDFSVSDVQKQRLISGRFSIKNMMLNILSPFIPEVSQLKGNLSANGRFGGTLGMPLLFGEIVLNDGELETKQDIINISQLNTQMKITGSSGTINGKMQAGGGVLNLGGNIDWASMPPSGEITLSGQRLKSQYPNIGQLSISPQLKLKLGKKTSITGEITIPWANIKIDTLPPIAIARSNDVTIINSNHKYAETKNLDTAINVNVKVKIEKDVMLDAFGLKTELQGVLHVTQMPDKPIEVNGIIKLLNGQYRSFGQDLIINKGNIIFSGPPSNPYLDLEAIRTPDTIEDNITVGVLVSGPAAKPEWVIFSNPVMSQTEQFSYLLKGHAIKPDEEGGSALQATLIALGVSTLDKFATSIGNSVGVRDLTLDTIGSGNDTQITISGYIAPKLKILYGIGVFNSLGEVKVKYELMPKLYIQAMSGLAESLDIFYQFSL